MGKEECGINRRDVGFGVEGSEEELGRRRRRRGPMSDVTQENCCLVQSLFQQIKKQPS